MDEYSMYICPKCKKTFKVKGSNKKVKCSQCSVGLIDMNVSLEAWSVIDKANKNNIIKNTLDKRIHQISKSDNTGIENDTLSLVKSEFPKENVLPSEAKTKDDYLKRLENEIRKNGGNILSFSELNEIITEFSPSYRVTMSEISNDMKVIIRKIGRERINNDSNNDPISKREIIEEKFYTYLCPSCEKIYKIPADKKNERCSSCNTPLRSLVIVFDEWTKLDDSKKKELIQSNINKHTEEKKSSFFDIENDISGKKSYSSHAQTNNKSNMSNFARMDEYEKSTYASSRSNSLSVNPINRIADRIADRIVDHFSSYSRKKTIIIGIMATALLITGTAILGTASERNQKKARLVSEMTGLSALNNPKVINEDWENKTFDASVSSIQNGSELILYNRLSDTYSNDMRLKNIIDESTGDTYCLGDRIGNNGVVWEGKLLFKNRTEVLFDKESYDIKRRKEEQSQREKETKALKSSSSSSGSNSSSSAKSSSGSYSSSSAREVSLSTDDQILYWTIAEQEVKARLKSPRSAKFPWGPSSDGVSVKKKGDIVTVIGYVDADNSFGASIRNVFLVELKINGNKYSVQSCIFL